MDNKRAIGAKYEQIAAQYLKEQGYEILEQNFFCRRGEIDLIARDGDYLVFVEVKYRKDTRHGFPQEAVDRKKQIRIYQAAEYYRYRRRVSDSQPCRFDVVVILGEQVEVIQNAFGGF